MSETIRSLVDVRVDGGPSMSAAPSITVAAYDKASVTVDPGTPETVPLQPGAAAQVALLMVTSTRYADADLGYTLGGETIALDAPQLFTGSGMLSLFASDPEDIVITNDLDASVTVSVLVARTTP